MFECLGYECVGVEGEKYEVRDYGDGFMLVFEGRVWEIGLGRVVMRNEHNNDGGGQNPGLEADSDAASDGDLQPECLAFPEIGKSVARDKLSAATSKQHWTRPPPFVPTASGTGLGQTATTEQAASIVAYNAVAKPFQEILSTAVSGLISANENQTKSLVSMLQAQSKPAQPAPSTPTQSGNFTFTGTPTQLCQLLGL